MKRLAASIALSLIATAALAHPSVSVVIDSRGNVYYSDLEQVWQISPDGKKTIAVPNVHTHELYLDGEDNLFGEHLWYNGERLNTWGSRVWRRSPDGRVVDIVPTHAGFNDNYGFVRDRAGNRYWADRAANTIRKRTPDGAVVALARADFRDIRWMNVTPDGTVYLVDKVDLMRVTPDGRVTTVTRGLSRGSLLRLSAGGRHQVMGLWFDRAGNVYVADYAGGKVKRVSPQGRVTVVAESRMPWSPTGGTFDRDGALWLLEYSAINRVRLRKIGRDGRETIY